MTGRSDILIEIKEELLREGMDASIVTRVMGRIRTRWAGETVYILKCDYTERNQRMLQAMQQHESDKMIARRNGISLATVRRKKSEWL